jgi:3-dehydroquinate synthase
MDKVRVGGPEGYEVYVAEGVLGEAARILGEKAEEKGLKGKDVFIATDRNVARHYLKPLARSLKKAKYRVSWSIQKSGERLKSIPNLHRLLRVMTQKGLARDSCVIALGGGVIGDLAGFAASIYMRGCNFIQVPTTLMAQVDSSIGGKVGINLREGKNLVGTFYNPLFVVIDPSTLRTLDAREFAAGFAEIIKYGLIFKNKLFFEIESFLAQNLSTGNFIPAEELKSRLLSSMDLLTSLILGSIKVKGEIVTEDEREKNLRMILNFGHTFGHAIEMLTRYRRFLHGEAVLMGMEMAVELSSATGMLSAVEAERALKLLQLFELPSPKGLSEKAIYRQISRDKKKREGRINYILLREIGTAFPEPAVEKKLVLHSIGSVLKRRKK